MRRIIETLFVAYWLFSSNIDSLAKNLMYLKNTKNYSNFLKILVENSWKSLQKSFFSLLYEGWKALYL